MKPGYLSLPLAGGVLSLGTLLGATALQAQDTQAPRDMLVSAAETDDAQPLGLPGPELAALFSAARVEERLQLVSALPVPDLDQLVRALADAEAEPGLTAGLVTASLLTDPDSQIGTLVTASFAAEELRPVAVAMVDEIGERCAMLDPEELESMILAMMSLDRSAAEALIDFGNAADAECAAQLAPALVAVTEGEDPMIASALETALAVEGGLMMQMVSTLRGEVDVAATDGGATPGPAQPAFEAVPPAPILDSGNAEESPATRQHARNGGTFGGNMAELSRRTGGSSGGGSSGNGGTDDENGSMLPDPPPHDISPVD